MSGPGPAGWPCRATGAAIALWLLLALLLAPFAARADQSDPRLDDLFAQLGAAPDVYAAAAVEQQIWSIWIEIGRGDVDRLVSDGIEAMSRGRIGVAIGLFERVIQIAPQYAEGWNKRATAYYLADELEASMEDIRRTLVLEPRHFGAISGMGLIFLRLDDERSALRAFQEVLKIHPQSPGARAQVKQLGAKLRGEGA